MTQIGRKYSKKRAAILELLCSTKEHPSAEWIYSRLKPAYPDLSLGTVYRNLNLFLEQGEIIERGTHEELLEKKGRYYQLYTGAVELA